MQEIWKDVPGYEGNYQVSNLGRIKSLKRNGCLGGIISAQISKGYLSIKLCKNNVATRITIHKIVASAFLTKPSFYECINHIDGNKQNNCPENLEYTTVLLNNHHAIEIGLCKDKADKISKYRTGRTGLLCHASKAVIQCNLITKQEIKEFISATFAAKETGVCRQHISQCCTGSRNKAGGYFWKHKN